MNEPRFCRINIPADAECKPELRIRWHGKIVGPYDAGLWWSLEGPQGEGVGITCPDDWCAELTSHEVEVARLLEATFWHRDRYTEDLEVLRQLPQDRG
jgi:hypothetical protein